MMKKSFGGRLAVAGMVVTMMAVMVIATLTAPRVDLSTKESRLLYAEKNIDSIDLDSKTEVDYSVEMLFEL